MMLKGQEPANIYFGNSFSDDGHGDPIFDYLLANPPFGVEWRKVKEEVEDEAKLGHAGRFGAGLPRINDGSFLFLQHMLSKMRLAEKDGARLAIVFNGSPLFTGAAESGESNIRRWILENDLLEGIVGLPDQLFYNTGISTYFWILSNRKAPALRRKVILLDARDQWIKMRKSLGDGCGPDGIGSASGRRCRHPHRASAATAAGDSAVQVEPLQVRVGVAHDLREERVRPHVVQERRPELLGVVRIGVAQLDDRSTAGAVKRYSSAWAFCRCVSEATPLSASSSASAKACISDATNS
jgi:N-6 DNA Methylase